MCKGLTHRGLPCKSKVFAEYCRVHLDQTPIPLYNRPFGWPNDATIMGVVMRLPRASADGVIEQLVQFRSNWRISPHISFEVREDTIRFANREYLIRCVETIKNNRIVCYTDDRLQTMVMFLSTKLDEIPELGEYIEDFRRRCLVSHRDAARKRVYAFYFKRCEDLCDDVIEKVLGFL
jgi:hypothetical protein